jgi:hypothetical protein
MGIALHHEVAPHRPETVRQEAGSAPGSTAGAGSGATGTQKSPPRKPALDEMGPGVESLPAKQEAGSAEGATGKRNESRSGPRSTMGRAGMHGGWKPKGR